MKVFGALLKGHRSPGDRRSRRNTLLTFGRLGSATLGDPLPKTGDALGKLLRSLFLCDYFTLVSFHRELLRLLNLGELVHSYSEPFMLAVSPRRWGAGKKNWRLFLEPSRCCPI